MFTKFCKDSYCRFGMKECYIKAFCTLARSFVYELYALCITLGQSIRHTILNSKCDMMHTMIALVKPLLYCAVRRCRFEKLQLHLSALQKAVFTF